MASGCIVGECPVCDEWIFEDEWTLVGNRIVHVGKCRQKYVQRVSMVGRSILLLESLGYVVVSPDEKDLKSLIKNMREEHDK